MPKSPIGGMPGMGIPNGVGMGMPNGTGMGSPPPAAAMALQRGLGAQSPIMGPQIPQQPRSPDLSGAMTGGNVDASMFVPPELKMTSEQQARMTAEEQQAYIQQLYNEQAQYQQKLADEQFKRQQRDIKEYQRQIRENSKMVQSAQMQQLNVELEQIKQDREAVMVAMGQQPGAPC